MPRLPRTLVAPLLALAVGVPAAAAVAASPGGGDGGKPDERGKDDRAAARILDGVPVIPGSDTSQVEDRTRAYLISSSPTAVLEFYRTELTTLGWTERSASQSSETSSSGEGDQPTGGPEVGNRGPEPGGLDSGRDPDLVGRVQVVFSRPGARLRVTVESVDDADAQTGTPTENLDDVVEYRLHATPRQ